MGWLKIGTRSAAPVSLLNLEDSDHVGEKPSTQHIESIGRHTAAQSTKIYPHMPISLRDCDLPYIRAEEVATHNSRQSGILWIVVDEVVYDCTDFISVHPGGEAIIESFGGTDCSWQFWRFHGKKEMEESGRSLRIGRTKGLVNKYKEPVKYVGLLKRGLDEW